jgi:hypothetical protein
MKKNTKRCSRCKQYLPIDNYSKSVNQKDGKNNYCKACAADYQHESRKRVYEKNPSLELLKRSCQAAFRRSQSDYTINGYGNVSSSYKSVKEFCTDLWNDDAFRFDWVTQTNVFLLSDEARDRPTLDRIDSSKGYEKSNIRMLPQWQNVTDGALKDCQVFVIKDNRVDHMIDYSGIGEAKKDIADVYHVPINTLNCVDHGTIVQAGNGVSLLLQTRDGQLKAGDESKYLMVVGKTNIFYELDTGIEVAREFQQFQQEVSGIEIRSLVS